MVAPEHPLDVVLTKRLGEADVRLEQQPSGQWDILVRIDGGYSARWDKIAAQHGLTPLEDIRQAWADRLRRWFGGQR